MSPVEPMYIAGRLRTASRPSKTVIESAPYSVFALANSLITSDNCKLLKPNKLG